VDPIAAAVDALRAGRFVLIYDGDGREEETDLVLASESATPEAIRTMRRDGGGLVCVTIRDDARALLGLPFLVDVLRQAARTYPILGAVANEDLRYDRHSAFSITINHRDTFTGITDRDRALTISRFATLAREAVRRENGWAQRAFAEEFRAPGHVPILNAAEPLLEARRGHTELATALASMARLVPSATLCEMMADDGRALSKEDAKAYARARNLVFLEGQDIVRAWRTWSV
jgi:3,4-dihydroxy 2-butanone 4-phosphate synthase